MSALDWMDIIYPLNSGLFGGYVVVKVLYMIIVRRAITIISNRMLSIVKLIIVADVGIGLSEIGVHWLLSRMTGNSPPVNIDDYRYYVVIARGAMAICLMLSVSVQLISILEVLTGGKWSKLLFWRKHHG